MRGIELIIFIVFFGFVGVCSADRDRSHQSMSAPLKIGALFDLLEEEITYDEDGERTPPRKSKDINVLMYKYAGLLLQKKSNSSSRRIEAKHTSAPYGDEFEVKKEACNLIKEGVIGLIGPSSQESSIHLRSICDTKEIPLIETTIDGSSKHVINLYPTPETLGMIYLDMIEAWGWDGFTIVYQDAPWLPLVEYILANHKNKNMITVREIDLTDNKNFRPTFMRIRDSKSTNILLCSSSEDLHEILVQAQQVGIITNEYSFIITSLDMHAQNMVPFQYSSTNITGMRLVIPNDPFVNETMIQIAEYFYKENKRSVPLPEGLTAEKLQLSTALRYDALVLYHNILQQYQHVDFRGIDCEDPEAFFEIGTSIFNSMRSTPPFKGLSGEIQFDPDGNRADLKLEILELGSSGLEKIGTWTEKEKIVSTRGATVEVKKENPDIFFNKTFIVLTTLTTPYTMQKMSVNNLTGNAQYEGFAVELFDKLAEKLGFNFIIKLQLDEKYGKLDKVTKQWDGMLRELMDDRADFAINDLTITSERESAVDFTMPFMTLGIQILFEVPTKDDPKLYAFLEPFHNDVWMCVAASFFMVSISLFIMGRMSPAEWDNPFPCIEEPDVLVNQFTFKNSMWFAIGAVLQQGSEIAPKAPSTRIVASMWWFFTLIMVSSYTANLAAFLTQSSPKPLFKDAADLQQKAGEKYAKDNGLPFKIMYGAKSSGSTRDFFDNTGNPTYKKMKEFMDENPTYMLGGNDKGVDKVYYREKDVKYAFLMESTTIEYNTQRRCNITGVGNWLDEKGYGIAMKKESPYRGKMSETILQMQESGDISALKKKWWNEKNGGGACDDTPSADNIPLNMKNVLGIFVVCAYGCGIALIIGVSRWIFNMWMMKKAWKIPFMEVLLDEVRFFFRFGTHVKEMKTRKSSSRLESMDESRGSRSRSSNNNLRASLKNINKISPDDEFDKI